MRKTYRGQDIEVTFDLDLCIHVGECLRGSPSVFKLDRRPWALPDAGDANATAAVIEMCPSGALQYRRLDGGPNEDHRGSARVTPIRDGPLMVVGEIQVTRDDGTVEVLPRATLCRCGESDHKPFCDNHHLHNGFKAPGSKIKIHLTPVRAAPDKPIAKADDPRRLD